jgi:hypothetical protein
VLDFVTLGILWCVCFGVNTSRVGLVYLFVVIIIINFNSKIITEYSDGYSEFN